MFIKQSAEKKRRERARLLKALEKRAQELVHMIDAFPPEFLPKDITVLIYRCLIDTYQQLTSIANEPEHVSSYQMYCAGMEKVMTEQSTAKRISLSSPQQIGQIKQYLNYLAKLLSKLHIKGTIDKQQHGQYYTQLKKLIHQISVDNYSLSAQQAEQTQKLKLALHNLKMAEKVLVNEGVLVQQKEQTADIRQRIESISAAIEANQEEQFRKQQSSSSDAHGTDSEWSKSLGQKDADWKKNNVYD